MRVLRWIVCLPAAFVASVAIGGAAWWISHYFGGSTWYSWLLSGVGSAFGFFFVAFKVAPRPTPQLKWAAVFIVGTMGTLSALGILITGNEFVESLPGLVMLGTAIQYARMPITDIQADVAKR